MIIKAFFYSYYVVQQIETGQNSDLSRLEPFPHSHHPRQVLDSCLAQDYHPKLLGNTDVEPAHVVAGLDAHVFFKQISAQHVACLPDNRHGSARPDSCGRTSAF